MNAMLKIFVLLVGITLFMTDAANAQIDDLEIVHTETQEIVDADGSVKLRIDWL
jgi:hypothetical protein